MKEKTNYNFPENPEFENKSLPNSLPYLSMALDSIANIYSQLKLWFNNLPNWGRIVVLISAIIVGIKIVETVLKLISLSIILMIIGGGIYLVYKFFIATTSSEKK